MSEMSIFEIAAQFPELSPVIATYLGEGCDSAALLVNGAWVFRFPKTPEVESQLAIETLLLPAIADRLPLEIPRFRFLGRPGEHFPRRFVGYPKLAGVPGIELDSGELAVGEAGAIGRFLAALHAVPVADAAACGVPVEDLASTIGEIRDEAVADMVEVERVAPDAPHGAWRRFLESPPPVASSRTALAHNDLAAEHLLVDPDTRRVTGVIDWSDAAITRPEVDFAGLFHWGGETFVRAVLPAYEAVHGSLGDEALRVARYLGACRGAMDVAFGIEMQKPQYVTAGLRGLRLCVMGPRDGSP